MFGDTPGILFPARSKRAVSVPEPRETESAGSMAANWLADLSGSFQEEINQLKELAIGTLFGIVKDVVTKAVPPQLEDQLTQVIDNVTQKLGGQPIRGPILPHGESETFGANEPAWQRSGSSCGHRHEVAAEM